MNENDLKVFWYGLLHALVAFSVITVVTQVLGFNLPMAFLFAGVGTLVFHLITKNKLPVTLGVSALYIGAILSVKEEFGIEYAMGGIVLAGIFYVIFGLVMLKWQDSVLKLFPNWLLSVAILLIGISLVPIGTGMFESNIVLGLLAFLSTAIVDIFGKGKIKMLAMPVGLLVGTLYSILTTGLNLDSLSNSNVGLEIIFPKFALEPALTVGLLAFAVMFEMMGDTKNIGHIIGKDAFKEVGLGRIAIGNGVSTILGGAFGANAYTTYSENAGFLLQSKYYNPNAQLFTGAIFIAIAFFTPLLNLIQLIPSEAFGGVVLYLFGMIATNAVRQLAEDKEKIANDKVFGIIVTMVGIAFVTFVIGGVSVSSIAIAILVGVILNSFVKYQYNNE